KIALVDRRKEAFRQSPSVLAVELVGSFMLEGFGGKRHFPVPSVRPQSELDASCVNFRAEQRLGLAVALLFKPSAEFFDNEPRKLSQLLFAESLCVCATSAPCSVRFPNASPSPVPTSEPSRSTGRCSGEIT
ncbi:MAG: hypothetical protein HGA59_09055, partial [Chlorobiaceae bacterium]|nr:hypothetical protein [Chlorobiaceae bacterium]